MIREASNALVAVTGFYAQALEQARVQSEQQQQAIALLAQQVKELTTQNTVLEAKNKGLQQAWDACRKAMEDRSSIIQEARAMEGSNDGC